MTGSASAPRGAAVALADFEKLARAVLPDDVWDFVAGGSGAETTLAANRAALDSIAVYPRVLPGGPAEAAVELFGTPATMPVAIAPMAYQRLLHPDGELAMAAAAAAVGVPLAVSTLSSVALEDVAKSGAELWFQLYWVRDRELLVRLVERAEAAGCRALMVTVDLPVMGRRLRDVRNTFYLPPEVIAANLADGAVSAAHQAGAGRSAVAAHTADMIGPALGWADLEWLLARTGLPLVLKGILDPDDAWQAVSLGAAGIVVSNHGGRQFDGAPASVDALPAVVEAVAGACPVLLDSGIRGGTDALRALALGASGVLVGRPLLWALAAGGAAGVTEALELLRLELTDALTLAGCRTPAAAGRLRTGRQPAGRTEGRR